MPRSLSRALYLLFMLAALIFLREPLVAWLEATMEVESGVAFGAALLIILAGPAAVVLILQRAVGLFVRRALE